MSASQARLLQLTARMTDVTNRGQNLQNVKIQLAASQDILAADYANELDQLSTMLQQAKAQNNGKEWTQMNGAYLLDMGATIVYQGRTVTTPGEEPEQPGPEPQKSDFTAEADFRAEFPDATAYVTAQVGKTESAYIQDARAGVSESTYTSKIGSSTTTDEEGNTTTTYTYDGRSVSSEAEANSLAQSDYKAAQDDAANQAKAEYAEYTTKYSAEYQERLAAAQGDDQLDYEMAHTEWKTKDDAHKAWQQNKEDYEKVKGLSSQQLASMMTEDPENFQIYMDRDGDGSIDDNEYISDYTSTDMLNAAYEAQEAKATAEYEAQMKKLSNKEKKIDMEIKQLDTEYNALKTEHDSLKAVIKDNTEKTFGTFSG